MKCILFSDNTAWGLYNFRRAVMLHFIKHGYDVSVCVPYDPVYTGKLEAMGCKVHPIQMETKGINPLKDFRVIWSYYKVMRKVRPLLSITYTIKPNVYGGMVARWLGIRYLAIVPGAGTVFMKRSLVTWIVKILYVIGFRKASHVWFLNQDDANLFRREGMVPFSKIGILDGEGIDLSLFPLKVFDDCGREGKELIFLMTGRLLREKGVFVYAEAARLLKKKYKKVRFQLLGMLDSVYTKESITREDVEEWQKEGIVDYLGTTSDVSSVLQKADILVLPSFYREGIPRSLMEGAATGLPIVTTDHTGCREMVMEGYNGFLCKICDVESLAGAMERMINLSVEERCQMGLNGRLLVEKRFDVKKVIHRYDQTVNEILSNK